MLRKLLKYELLFIGKFWLIFAIITPPLAGLARLAYAGNSTFAQILASILTSGVIACLVNMAVNVLIRFWVRFRQNFYGDESYLTHTLPVKRGTQYNAKVFGGLISMFATLVFAILCLLLAFGTKSNFEWIKNMLFTVESAMDISLGSVLFLLALTIVLQYLCIMLMGYFGIVVGHRFDRAKLGMSVVFGIVAYVVTSVVSLMVIMIVGAFVPDIRILMTSEQLPSQQALIIMLILACVIYFFISIIIYVLGRFIFQKGVNVD